MSRSNKPYLGDNEAKFLYSLLRRHVNLGTALEDNDETIAILSNIKADIAAGRESEKTVAKRKHCNNLHHNKLELINIDFSVIGKHWEVLFLLGACFEISRGFQVISLL